MASAANKKKNALQKKKKKKKKSHMGQKAKRAARPARRAWPGGFARLLIISHCVSQH
jgi:hypothetical protein